MSAQEGVVAPKEQTFLKKTYLYDGNKTFTYGEGNVQKDVKNQAHAALT